jgi:hypothetical protein
MRRTIGASGRIEERQRAVDLPGRVAGGFHPPASTDPGVTVSIALANERWSPSAVQGGERLPAVVAGLPIFAACHVEAALGRTDRFVRWAGVAS